MNLFELFVKIGVDDQASGKLSKLSSSLGKGLATAAKIGTAAVGAASTAIAALTTQAVNGFAEYEQLAGGAQKIFNDMDFSKISEDAQNAYKELGLSANQYLAVINDVGATFAATMGDEAGYETAKTGLKAISDYASGTGKNVDELSQKFTLITRSTSSYQSIADQFSGILPATSAGFLEQAQAAGILSDSYTQLTQVPIDEYQAAVSKMLQRGVSELGLANNTVLEAETTISGSLAAMRASWSNLIAGVADENANLEVLVGNFVDSAIIAGEQLLPRVEAVLNGAGQIIDKVVPIIIDKIPEFIEKYLPKILESGVSIVLELAIGLIKAIPSLVKSIPQIVVSIVNAFKSKSGDFTNIGKNIVNGIKSGISKMWSNLKTWFRNLFGDLIYVAKKILGIASPSKVFKKLGGFTAEGFGVGFEDEFARVKSDMEDAMSFEDASIGINASVRKIGAGASGRYYGGTSIGSVTINIDGAEYDDPRTFATIIAEELQRMTERSAAVYA